MPFQDNSKNRDLTLDIVKGIGILCVIIAHFNPFLRHSIYSFHMPLFFIIGGLLFTPKNFNIQIRKDIRRLLLPYFLIGTSLLLFSLFYAILKNQKIFQALIQRGIAIIMPTGHSFSTELLNFPISGMIVWFLFAMFWCKTVYNLLINKISASWLLLVSLSLSLIAIFIDTKVFKLPFALLPGLGALLFFAIGDWLSNNKEKYGKIILGILILASIGWIAFEFFESTQNIEMYSNEYEFYPRDVLFAIGGTFAVWCICKFCIVRIKFLNKFLAFCGMNSLFILCIHTIDYNIPIGYFLGISQGVAYFLFSCLLYLLVGFIAYRFKFLRNTFGIVSWQAVKKQDSFGRKLIETS